MSSRPPPPRFAKSVVVAFIFCSLALLLLFWSGIVYVGYRLDSRMVQEQSRCYPTSSVTRSLHAEISFDKELYWLGIGPRRGELHRYAGPGAFYFRFEAFPLVVVDTTHYCVQRADT